jgi:chromosome segregation ATPase
MYGDAMPDQQTNLERLIIDLKESVERDIQGLRESVDSLHTRFDTQAARIERQGALIQTGSRWTSRMGDWSEKVDAALEHKDKQIVELTRRIEKLESAQGQKPN